MFYEEKSIKLKGSKLIISQVVEFGRCRISRKMLGAKGCVFFEPKQQRIRAFEQLNHPISKKEAQVFLGMVASLSKWQPSSSLVYQLIRKATAGPQKQN